MMYLLQAIVVAALMTVLLFGAALVVRDEQRAWKRRRAQKYNSKLSDRR